MDIVASIKERIYKVRDELVVLDRDLAFFYRIAAKEFSKEIKKHSSRFTNDLMFRLTNNEWDKLKLLRNNIKSGNILAEEDNSKAVPHVFTEQGVLLLHSVFRTVIAIKMNIAIMQAFAEIRNGDTL